ncbi:MAG: gamma-glutamylcysteine synthetase [Proteobacteria bacterium]|nr:gamma-glutamylcysteine synthetase [Pseudomonadota bacterium]
MTKLIKHLMDGEIGSRKDLIDYIRRGERSPEAWGIGMEVEKQVIDSATGYSAHYDSIESFLKNLEKGGAWKGIREDGHLIALMGEDSSITLEPGGQLELSGKVCPHIQCSQKELKKYIEEIIIESKPLGLTFLGIGVQPFTKMEEICWLPKARYNVMGPYMARTGDMGQRMMKQSAGIQVNIDFSDEEDCIEKLRMAMVISPLFYALFANSPIMDGKPSGFLSTRGEIWSRTDKDRTGLITNLFNDGAGYGSYVDYALEVPMYFIMRKGAFIDLTKERFTFNRYLKEGFNGLKATMDDWSLHLSTLFPEARLRPQIEIRSFDSLPPRYVTSVGAFIKGLFYDDDAKKEITELFSPADDFMDQSFRRCSWQQGLKASIGGRTLREIALDAISISRRSLKRQSENNKKGLDETFFLDNIEEIAESGQTLADTILAGWKGSQEDKLKMLIDHCGYRKQ